MGAERIQLQNSGRAAFDHPVGARACAKNAELWDPNVRRSTVEYHKQHLHNTSGESIVAAKFEKGDMAYGDCNGDPKSGRPIEERNLN